MSRIDPRFIRGAKGGGKGGGKKAKDPVTAPDSLRSNDIARVFDIVSEGKIGGLINGLQSVYLDGTPVQNADGSMNFDGVKMTELLGTPEQDPVAGFSNAEAEVVVNTQVTQASSVTRTVSDPDLDALRIKVRIPALQNVDNKGNVLETAVSIAIDVQPNGGSFGQVLADTISGKCSSPYEREYRVSLPAGGAPWTVRVRRTTPDAGSALTSNDTYWATYTKVIDSKLSYPNVAGYVLDVNSQQFGDNVPGRGYEISGIEVLVPMNWDPDTRVYATTGPGTTGGIWDGTFKRAATDNPAWILYDLLTEPRYGLGDDIDLAAVDKWTLYDIAQYCDGMVADGKGGLEPRFTFNGVLNTREDAFTVIRSIASSFRGFVYWGAGSVSAVQDCPSDPDLVVNQTNVIDGQFNYEGSDDLVRHSVALVTWNDPNNGYLPTVEVVEDPAAIALYGRRPIEIAAYGCTSRGLARRIGKWALDTEQHETEIVTYQAGYDHAQKAFPGRLIQVVDPALAPARYGGRIAAATATSITVDAPIDIVTGETYNLTVVTPAGALQTRTLTNATGTASVLTFATPLPDLPQVESSWIISTGAVQPRTFRIMAVEDPEEHIYKITALLNDPTKYSRIEQDINLPDPDYSSLPSGPLSAPTNLSFTEFLYQAGLALGSAVDLGWTAPNDSRVLRFEYQAQRPGDPDYIIKGTTTDKAITVTGTSDGPFSFRVRSLDAFGSRSQWATLSGTLGALAAPPADVTGFSMNVLGNVAYLSWNANADLDLDHYVIKFSPLLIGATWGSASSLVPTISGTSVQVPALSGTYLIKAVDQSGSLSVNASSIASNIDSLLSFDVTENLQENPGFTGTKTNLFLDDLLGGLRLDYSRDIFADADWFAPTDWFMGSSGIAVSGTYLFATTVDLTSVFTSRVTISLDAAGVNFATDFFAPMDFFASEDVFNVDPSFWSVDIELRITNDDPAGSPTWSAWQPLVIGDYNARAFQFRAILYSHQFGVSPIVRGLTVNVNMPDRTEAANNVTIPLGGLRVNFLPPFKRLEGVAYGTHDLLSGDKISITAKDETGFNIIATDSGGSDVVRTTDWVAKGYGRVTA